jgi:hypothetical protein
LFGFIAAVAVIGIISAAAHKSGSSPARNKVGSGTVSHPATADIVLSGYTVDEIGAPHAKATVVNHSSKTSNYTFEGSFMDATVVAQGAGARKQHRSRSDGPVVGGW